jgi:hypothetical protein
MREIEKISTELFDKIRSRFENVSVGNDQAKSTSDPEQARFFNFNYIDQFGKNYGNVTISLIDENSLKIYFTKDLVSELGPEEQKNWFDFLRSMRMFAKRNLLTFDTRDINRSNLKTRDLKQISKSGGTYKKHELDLQENRLYGSSKSSYQTMGPVKLIVRHNDNIDETVHGARTRNIEAIFIETHIGERFLLPFKKLTPARAMARHISEGGNLSDDVGQHIIGVVNEMGDLNIFVRKMRNRTFEDSETTTMVEASIERYNELHDQLVHMRSTRGYRSFKENFTPQENLIFDDIDIDELKERFVQKIFDDRLSEALPYVYRAYKNKKLAMENTYIAEIESWADDLVEGTWATPKTDKDKDDLRELMKSPIEAGVDGTNARGILYNLIGSDSLYDEFIELSQSEQGPEVDVRPLIVDWLSNHGYPELSKEFNDLIQQQTTGATTNQIDSQTQTTTNQVSNNLPSTSTIPNNPTESVDQIIRLAGLRTLKRL